MKMSLPRIQLSTFSFGVRGALRVARAELSTFFASPAAYIVAGLYLAVSEFLFLRGVFGAGEASLTLYYALLPWLFLLVVPAFTMGLIASERDSGTYERLSTEPLGLWVIVMGKYAATVAFLAGILALAVLPLLASFSLFAELDLGQALGGYVASVLLAALFAALGLFASSLFKKQVSALLVTVVLAFLLVIVGLDLVASVLPASLAFIADRLSVMAHFNSMIRGVLDTRDLWYFVSGSLVFLFAAHYRLLGLRGARPKLLENRPLTLLVLAVLLVLASNIAAAYIPGRLDLTRHKLYTVSDATRTVLAELPEDITLTVYASGALPAQLQPTLRDVRDMAKDYVRYGKGRVRVEFKDPGASSEVASEAQGRGVTAIQFNTVGQGKFEVQEGYLGVAVTKGEEHKAISFVEQTNDLEYQLTSRITELTQTNKKKLRFLSGHGEKYTFSGLENFVTELGKQYDVSTVSLTDDIGALATGTDALVIAAPTQPIPEAEQEAIRAYVRAGGALVALLPGAEVDQQGLSATPVASTTLSLLAPFGLTVQPNIVYDLQSSEVVQMQGGNGRTYLVQYPFWVRAIANRDATIMRELAQLTVTWASELTLDEAVLTSAGVKATPLLVTTRAGGAASEPYTLTPNTPLPQENLSMRMIGVALEGSGERPFRAVVVGSGTILDDQLTGQGAEHLAFGLGAVSWAAQDKSLAGVKAKGGVRTSFEWSAPYQQLYLVYGNIAFALFIVFAAALGMYVRRRTLARHTYATRPLGKA